MKTTTFARYMIAVMALVCIATTTQAAPYVPPSVVPGSNYHLVFISQGTRDGTSSLILDYNNFVQTEATANPVLTGTNVGVNYRAIASTTVTDAFANVPITAPVYNFNGDLIAIDSADMWDGILANAIVYDQFAFAGFPDVWSGGDQFGAAVLGSEMGSSNPRTGLANLSDLNWINNSVTLDTTLASVYGLSEQLTAVPEPSTFALAALGMLSLSRVRRKRRR